MNCLGVGGETSAAGTRCEVSVEALTVELRSFAVEPGGDGGTGITAFHTEVVRSGRRLVPQYRRPAVDQLTRLLVAAQSGDRLALNEFIRATQPEVWRMSRHLVGPDSAELAEKSKSH